MDRTAPASVSTDYCRETLLTHIDGPTPIISFPTQNIAFHLADSRGYDSLPMMTSRYLDRYEDVALLAR